MAPTSLPAGILQRIPQVHPAHWKQISRTVNGVPVDSSQIELIATAIVDRLDLAATDHLVDIGCGNGALAWILAPMCRSVLGIDPDEGLLEVARAAYSRDQIVTFEQGALPTELPRRGDQHRFTKALVYGAFAYIPQPQDSLEAIRDLYPNVRRLFVGQIPEASQRAAFTDLAGSPERLRRLDDAIGRWFDQDEFCSMAERAGWEAETSTMPKEFYAAHYRFDALLRPLP